MPDSSLLLYGFEIPFIVCEVAISQTLKSVMAKKRPYLLGSKNKVRFLIIIYLETERPSCRGSGKRLRDSTSPELNKRGRSAEEFTRVNLREDSQGQQGQQSDAAAEVSLSSPSSQYKSGYLYVYTTSVQTSRKNPAHRVRYIKPIVEKLVSLLIFLPDQS